MSIWISFRQYSRTFIIKKRNGNQPDLTYLSIKETFLYRSWESLNYFSLILYGHCLSYKKNNILKCPKNSLKTTFGQFSNFKGVLIQEFLCILLYTFILYPFRRYPAFTGINVKLPLFDISHFNRPWNVFTVCSCNC